MHTLLLICHCKVQLYAGHSCCIEVVDRQNFACKLYLSVNWKRSLEEPDIEQE